MSIDATKAQANYLEILFGDLGFTRVQRSAWMTQEVGHRIVYLDDLTKSEAHELIERLKVMKAQPVVPR